MDEAGPLEAIAEEMHAILSRFKRTREGNWIAEGDQTKSTGHVLEAQDLLGQSVLGRANSFGHQLEMTRLEGVGNLWESQSYHSVE